MSDLVDLPLRPELIGQLPYGAPQLKAKYKLNVNENPYPPGPIIRAEMASAILQMTEGINRYPDREAVMLREALANYLDDELNADQIWIANGSNEIMIHLLTAFGGPGRKMLIFTPSYSMYEEYARNTHTQLITASRDQNYCITSDIAVQAVTDHRPDVVIIASPNNPTGTVTELSVIDELCGASDAIVIVDEAYQEFSAAPSALTLLAKHPRLVVSRTMSKAFALAGGRVGYCAAARGIVDACRIVRLPYHLSAQTQAIALVALKHADEMLAQVGDLRIACQQLQQWLTDQGYQVVASEANFCLFGCFVEPHAVWQALLDQGVLIREVGPTGYLRVSAGTPTQMAAFQTAMLAMKENPTCVKVQ